MIRRPPRSTRTDTLFPYTTLFRSQPVVATVPVAPAPAAVDVELRAIDRALQAGYARNATDDELEALWAQRQRLLAGNDGTAGTPQPRGLHICSEDIPMHFPRTPTLLTCLTPSGPLPAAAHTGTPENGTAAVREKAGQ